MAVAEDVRAAASLPYHEPNIAQILVMASFLIVLNGVNSIIDRILYCGLVGQVLIGIAWGTPGAQWLASTLSSSTAAFEHVVVQLGYLGLILLVYEGGVSTSIASLKANLPLAIAVAATGIAAPMGLSFVLGPLVGATALQCFAAGAALCSTSLGTTFTVLSTSGLSATRLGSVLSTAAMMDDVVGLVMVQIVSSLGSVAGEGAGSSVSIEPVTVLRPVLVSVAFAVVIPLTNRFLLRPAMRYLDDKEEEKTRAVLGVLATREGALMIHTALLLGLVAAAAYAGASVLLAAYLAGIMVCWWDAERETRQRARLPSPEAVTPTDADRQEAASPVATNMPCRKSEHTGVAIYEHYYEAAVGRILKPFFFASIGFSIPITKMFSGPVVWKGLIYTALMILGKVLCGLWLIRLPAARGSSSGAGSRKLSKLSSAGGGVRSFFTTRLGKVAAAISSRGKTSKMTTAPTAATTTTTASPSSPNPSSPPPPAPPAQHQPVVKPVSLYPAGIISCAMVARGEIGFLISAVAESKGIFSSSPSPSAAGQSVSSSLSDEQQQQQQQQQPSDIFLIATWAIVLCTIIGPFAVGVLVRRVKKLEAQRRGGHASDEDHVLGAWGV
ncbi:Sodium/hydrogen exchanger family-domain-containing protein [Microdochium bolleyi]|uniref:Sodium/hydrogen exchanger family-domain-containing protein n=1 Tax=Microdochium bolleyi TaxID=196109 RepID=A0A136IXS6_9PEZI|nr:Sodium/hydrogen exchanger family-domain-containing protein [Microdochium bolleyi]